MDLNKKTLLDMLYFMKLTRDIENRIERKLYRQGKIVGGVYVGRGQEAIAVGSSIQLKKDDCICPSHRDMGAFLIRGITPREIFAQYMGRRTRISKGKEGNLHMGDMRRNIVAFVSMLADTVPVAAGIGMAYKMRKQKNVVLCYFGDGATSRGDWHEGINLASCSERLRLSICVTIIFMPTPRLSTNRWPLRIFRFARRPMACLVSPSMGMMSLKSIRPLKKPLILPGKEEVRLSLSAAPSG